MSNVFIEGKRYDLFNGNQSFLDGILNFKRFWNKVPHCETLPLPICLSRHCSTLQVCATKHSCENQPLCDVTMNTDTFLRLATSPPNQVSLSFWENAWFCFFYKARGRSDKSIGFTRNLKPGDCSGGCKQRAKRGVVHWSVLDNESLRGGRKTLTRRQIQKLKGASLRWLIDRNVLKHITS